MSELLTATISSGNSLSAAVDLRNEYVEKILMPAAWDAAALTFQVCETESGTYRDLYTETAEFSVSAAGAGRAIVVPPERWLGGAWLKVRSGTSGTPVNQTADRAIQLEVRRLR